MTYVVARYTFLCGKLMYTVMSPQEWEVVERLGSPALRNSYEKLFETETVDDAKALIALMPEGEVLT